jgi:hypothetical protein
MTNRIGQATPGPWKADGLEVCGDGQTVAVAEVIRRDHFESGFSEAKTNAHLIAAAPDMFEALEALVEAVMDDDPCEAFPIAKHAGRAALAKARGEQPAREQVL